MPATSDTRQLDHHRGRSRSIRRPRRRRAALAVAAAAAALSVPNVAAAETGGGPDLLPRQPLIAAGTGEVTAELPFCFNGAPGPCGWIIEGIHAGTPIRSGTFFAAVDHGNAVPSRRCVPATYSGVLYDAPTDQITYTAAGRVCPDRHGGHVFIGRFDNSSGYGRFDDVSSGHGRIRVTIGKSGSATLTLTGQLRRD